MSDIVEDLRFIAQIHEGRHRHACITDAADEIERLRALIDAWNEAERKYFSVVNPSPDVVGRFYSTLDALRAEVGR